MKAPCLHSSRLSRPRNQSGEGTSLLARESLGIQGGERRGRAGRKEGKKKRGSEET